MIDMVVVPRRTDVNIYSKRFPKALIVVELWQVPCIAVAVMLVDSRIDRTSIWYQQTVLVRLTHNGCVLVFDDATPN